MRRERLPTNWTRRGESLRRNMLPNVQFRKRPIQQSVNKSSTPNHENVRVPLFGNWSYAYLSVIVVFVLEVALFYFVSRYFA
jgi:hypothetical protein